MNRNSVNVFRKGLIFAIIVLLVGTSFIPAINGTIEKKDAISDTKESMTNVSLPSSHFGIMTVAQSHWHITTSGYESFVWCGEESTGTYDNDWDDVLILASDGKPSMDWTNDGYAITFSFNSYEEFEGSPYDIGTIEVNPHVSESGSHWYTYMPLDFGYYRSYWTLYNFTVTTSEFYNEFIGDFLSSEEPTFTSDMGVRFRFKSDSSCKTRGWMLDNIKIAGADKTYYGPNSCNDMKDFIVYGDSIYGEDWWYYDDVYGGWICQDKIALALPNNIDCALVWRTSTPQCIYANLHFYHEYDLELGGDYCYLEFSNNGGDTWSVPAAFSGTGAGGYNIDMTSFIGENVLIRWRVVTNDAGLSNYYKVKDLCITGQTDTEPPVTVGNLSGIKSHGYYSTPVTFTATVTDDKSGVKATYYILDGDIKIEYTDPVVISTNGDHHIEYWSVDKVGNEETHQTTESFTIDTGEPPTVSIISPEPGIHIFDKKIPFGDKVIIIGGITIEATANDSGSGIYRLQFLLDDVVFAESTAEPYRAVMIEKHRGDGVVKVIAEDFASNTAEDTLDVTYFKFL